MLFRTLSNLFLSLILICDLISTYLNEQKFISSVEGICEDDQLIFSSGHVLDAEAFANLSDGCQIEVTTRLLGGKVHGSLARAGKVKGQTPKVEKQVKKRKKCGRARRRILYRKRFLQSVNVPGKCFV